MKVELRSVTNFSEMFTQATSFNKPINKWNVENAIIWKRCFSMHEIQPRYITWNISKVENMKLTLKRPFFFC